MEQFKSLQELREYIARLEKWFARSIVAGEHPTLHLHDSGDRATICGIRREDYLFSACGNWVLPSKTHGLSFSAHWQHLKTIYKMREKRNKGKPISVYWVLQNADIPPGLEFVPDAKNNQHYLLCATERMHVEKLRSKLEWIADRMSIIEGA